MSEPLIDLIHVLGKLVDANKRVLIPGTTSIHTFSMIKLTDLFPHCLEFYDDVLPVSEAEEKLYDPIISWLKS